MYQRVCLALVIGLLLPVPGHAASPYEAVQRGNALYQDGQYEAAAQQYATAAQALPEAAEVLFNQGAAAYKQQDYASALDYYTRALQVGDRRLERRLKYNLGNAKYQQALAALHRAEDALTPLRAAMAYYRDSLGVDAPSPEARYNLELAYLLLRQLLPPRPQEQQNTQSQEQQAARPQEQQQQAQQPSQRQHAEQTGQPQASLDNADTPLQPSTVLEELSPEEAERLLATIRERAREADIRRQQWRQAGRPKAEASKDW